MTFRFTAQAQKPSPLLDLCLEASTEDGKIVQALFIRTTRGSSLVYREATSGPWLNTEGISFNGLPRTPENLIKAIGLQDPVKLVYVLPAA